MLRYSQRACACLAGGGGAVDAAAGRVSIIEYGHQGVFRECLLVRVGGRARDGSEPKLKQATSIFNVTRRSNQRYNLPWSLTP
jgi:hypothetical protein